MQISGEESIEEACRVAGTVDTIFLDSGKPSLKIREPGGTGRIHDWSIRRMIVEKVDIPVYLAGGLRAEF